MDNASLHWIHDRPGYVSEAIPNPTTDRSIIELLQNNFDGPVAFNFVEQVKLMKYFFGVGQATILAQCFCQLGNDSIQKVLGDPNLDLACQSAFASPFCGKRNYATSDCRKRSHTKPI